MRKTFYRTLLAVLALLSLASSPTAIYANGSEEIIEINPYCIPVNLPRYTVNANGTNFRATANGTILGQVQAGTDLARIGSTTVSGSSWLQFRIMNGVNRDRNGWIRADLVTRSGSIDMCW